MQHITHPSSRRARQPSSYRQHALAACISFALLGTWAAPASAQTISCDNLQPPNKIGTNGIVCGGQAEVPAGVVNGVAVGYQAKALADNSVALGTGATASGIGSIALGAGSNATGLNELAIGNINTGMTRRITGVTAGVNDTDAVNVWQLKKANLDNTLAVKYDWTDADGDGIADPGEFGDTITLADTGGTKIGSLANGAIAMGSLDAVNGGQIYGISKSVAAALGGTSAVDANGLVTAGLKIGETTYNTVFDALEAVNTTANTGWTVQSNGATETIAPGNTLNVINGTNTIAAYDVAAKALKVSVVGAPIFAGMVTADGGLTVGSGKVVDMGANVVTNVGAGTIDATSNTAVNGAQVFDVSQSVASALGGMSKVAADGTVIAPQYTLSSANTIAGTTGDATNVGAGFDKVDLALGALNTTIGDITGGNAGIRYFHVNSTADDSSATGANAIAIGREAIANQSRALALGFGAQAISADTTALGTGAWAYGYQSTAVGFLADTRGDYSSAFGSALAFGRGTTALGAWAVAGGDFDWTGDGGARPGDIVEIVNGTAVGFSSEARADNATALGAEAVALDIGSAALGSMAKATAVDAVAIGSGANASEANSVALGSASSTAAAVGTASANINGTTYDFAGAAPVGTVSVGSAGAERTLTNVAAGRLESTSTDAVNGSQLYATNQAIEAIGSVAGNANDLAVKYLWTDANGDGVATPEEIDYGSVVLEGGTQGTHIGNLAPGAVASGSMDAINGGQLFGSMSQVATYLGGGAVMTAQGLSAPSYLIQGATYDNVGDALQALDVSVTLLGGRPYGSQLAGYTHGQAGSGSPTYGNGGPGSTALGVDAHASGVEDGVAIGQHAAVTADYGTAVGQGASATAENAVALGHDSVADRANAVSVGSAGNERQVTNVADATQGTDAINKRQLDRGVASANSYTDARVNALSDSFELFQGNVDQRFRKQDRRIDRQGAMGAAMMNMAVSAAGIHTPNRVGIGVGFQGGESALSLGYQRAFSDRATLTFGGALSSDDQAVGIGAGFGW